MEAEGTGDGMNVMFGFADGKPKFHLSKNRRFWGTVPGKRMITIWTVDRGRSIRDFGLHRDDDDCDMTGRND